MSKMVGSVCAFSNMANFSPNGFRAFSTESCPFPPSSTSSLSVVVTGELSTFQSLTDPLASPLFRRVSEMTFLVVGVVVARAASGRAVTAVISGIICRDDGGGCGCGCGCCFVVSNSTGAGTDGFRVGDRGGDALVNDLDDYTQRKKITLLTSLSTWNIKDRKDDNNNFQDLCSGKLRGQATDSIHSLSQVQVPRESSIWVTGSYGKHINWSLVSPKCSCRSTDHGQAIYVISPFLSKTL